MKYTGRFKNVKNETIRVDIITNNSTSQEKEIYFASESPVVIVQKSPDNIFSPIKSRSCTITIITKEVYLDMYSATSHGTKVIIDNLTTGKRVFFGYLTPCEYNQPYLYVNELELEAVDAVSSLHDFKYTYMNNSSSSLVSIENILRRLIINTAGCTGGIYISNLGLMSKTAHDNGFFPTEAEVISEETFFDDDGESMTCYEVLEEICNFYNLSLIPYENDVYLIDYEAIANYGINHPNWDFYQDASKILFKDLISNNNVYLSVPKTISLNDYAGEDHNIEIDDVYNKAFIKCETKDIEDDDLFYDPIEEISSATFARTIDDDMQRSDGVMWKSVTRLFEFIKGSYGGWVDNEGKWQTIMNVNSAPDTHSYKLTSNFTNRKGSYIWGWMEFPYTTGYLFNTIVGQTCLPAQQFNFEATKTMPYTANWTDYLMFFPQAQWIYEYFNQNPTECPENFNTYEYWNDTFYEQHLGGTYPVLIYRGDKDIQYSPNTTDKIHYLAFTGNLLWQQNCSYDDVNYHLWSNDAANKYYGGTLFEIKNAGAHDTHAAYRRSPGQSGFNTGWPMLKMKLKIGDKYWNGERWTTVESTFWINYHRDNVVSEDETLIWSDYNKPVTNVNYTYSIGKDAFVIPIQKSDNLTGKLRMEIYMPRIPWSENVLYRSGDIYNSLNYSAHTDNLGLNYFKTPPVIFMKNLSLELVSRDLTEEWYKNFDDIDDKEDEITYSNTINTNNVEEMDDLTLKINTQNDIKPIAQSYILEPTTYSGGARTFTSIKSRHFEVVDPVPYTSNGSTKYQYTIRLYDFSGSNYGPVGEWWAGLREDGYFKDVNNGVVTWAGVEGVKTCDVFLSQEWAGGNPYVILRVGDESDHSYDTSTAAMNDADGIAFFQAAQNAGYIEFFKNDPIWCIPLNAYPINMREGVATSEMYNITAAMYHNAGFYRPHTNTSIREEENIINRYVGHFSTPKKIYNCTVHGYYEPWKCIKATAIDSSTKFVIDEQEYDLKADSNTLKLIEY